jgi:NADH dehydrogenase FAD-containing subunit
VVGVATIGRNAAVCAIGSLELTGFIGWLGWLVVRPAVRIITRAEQEPLRGDGAIREKL